MNWCDLLLWPHVGSRSWLHHLLRASLCDHNNCSRCTRFHSLKVLFNIVLLYSSKMSRLQSTNEKLSIIAGSLESANEALRDIVSQGNEEESRTQKFEEHYAKMEASYRQYEEEASNQDRQASRLKSRLEHEIMKMRNVVENLKGEISHLDEKIRDQDRENEGLDRKLRDRVKQYKVNRDDTNYLYTGASPIVPNHQNSIAQRLSQE